MQEQTPDRTIDTPLAIASNAPLVVAPFAPTSIVGKVTLVGRNKKSGLRHYALSLQRQGLLAGLKVGDVVQMMVVIQTPSGPYYDGVLEGTVAHVTKNRVRVYIYALYNVELACGTYNDGKCAVYEGRFLEVAIKVMAEVAARWTGEDVFFPAN